MEIGEAVKFILANFKDAPFCEGEVQNPPPNQKAHLHRVSGYTASGTKLKNNMEKVTNDAFTPNANPNGGKYWDMEDITPKAFPFQAHHLIPKAHLTKQPICVWLAVAKATSDYKLTADTFYSIDHANNGYAMPYSSVTKSWRKGGLSKDQKDAISQQVMAKTGIQLHQGAHSETMAEPDDEGNLRPGYLERVSQLLQLLFQQVLQHLLIPCEICNQSTSKPIKVQPLENTVRYVDAVSQILKQEILAQKIFVSRVAERCYGDALAQRASNT